MRRSPFIRNVVCCLFLLGCFNVASHFWFQTDRRDFVNRWEDSARKLPLNQPVDILLLGDSTTLYSYHQPDFKARWEELSGQPVSLVNAGVPASMVLEHCLTLRRALTVNPNIKCVVYGVFGLRLTDPAAGRRFGNPAGEHLEYFIEDQDYVQGRKGGGFRLGKILLWFPMYTEPSSYWVSVEGIRRVLGRMGMPQQKTTHPLAGAAEIGFPKELEFIHHTGQVTSGKIGFIRPIVDIVQVCRERGVDLVVVFMPTPQIRRERFMERPEWTAYYQRVQTEFSALDVPLIDASAWLKAPDEDVFSDPLHVNKRGAQILSARIAEELYALPSFRRKIVDEARGR
ncbi:MAG TPA: hypothetical protein VGH19_04105 [Verrucomicrobiae bacterium]